MEKSVRKSMRLSGCGGSWEEVQNGARPNAAAQEEAQALRMH